MTDPLDRYDFEQILDQFKFKPSLAFDRLETFFRDEIPARERRRAAATRPDEIRRITATIRVLSPHEAASDLGVIDAVNDVLHHADRPFRVAPIPDESHTTPAPGATPSPAVCSELAFELVTTLASNHVDGEVDIEGARIYVTDFLNEVMAGRPPRPEDKHFSRARFGKPKDGAVAGKKPKKTGPKRRAWPRVAALTAVFMTACGGADDQTILGDDQVDADAGELGDGGADIDADPTAPDAAPDAMTGGLPDGAACDPLAAECAGGLTCRVTSLEPVEGTCRAVGAALENDPCDQGNGDADCGPAMTCIGSGVTRCYVICDRADPVPRCGAADSCVAVWGADVEIGACSP